MARCYGVVRVVEGANVCVPRNLLGSRSGLEDEGCMGGGGEGEEGERGGLWGASGGGGRGGWGGAKEVLSRGWSRGV